MSTAAGVKAIAQYAQGVGVFKPMVLQFDQDAGAWGGTTPFMQHVLSAGLLVHPYTFRAENFFLPTKLRSDPAPTSYGYVEAEILQFLEAGAHGVFTDHPDFGVRAREAFNSGKGKKTE